MKERKNIEISRHCYDSMELRGVHENEIIEAINNSDWIFIKGKRYYAEKEFEFNDYWYGHWYRNKKVKVILAEEPDKIVAVTVLSFYY